MTFFQKTLTAVSLALIVTSTQANAGAREIYKCHYLEGAGYQDLIAAFEIYRAAMDAAGYSDYKVELLYPLYDQDIPPGTVFWQGTSPTMERLGAANDWFWFSNEAEASRLAFEKAVKCVKAAMYFNEALD